MIVNRALESGLRSNENVFLAAKIGDDCKQVDASEQLETVLTSAEYHGRFTEI